MAELKPAINHLMKIISSEAITPPEYSIEWPTDHGIIIGAPDKETLVLKTFVDIEKPGHMQSIRRAREERPIHIRTEFKRTITICGSTRLVYKC